MRSEHELEDVEALRCMNIYSVDGSNPIILVRRHLQLFHDIGRLSGLQDSDIGGIVLVNLI